MMINERESFLEREWCLRPSLICAHYENSLFSFENKYTFCMAWSNTTDYADASYFFPIQNKI